MKTGTENMDVKRRKLLKIFEKVLNYYGHMYIKGICYITIGLNCGKDKFNRYLVNLCSFFLNIN